MGYLLSVGRTGFSVGFQSRNYAMAHVQGERKIDGCGACVGFGEKSYKGFIVRELGMNYQWFGRLRRGNARGAGTMTKSLTLSSQRR